MTILLRTRCLALVSGLLLLSCITAVAQPSGGPYGPIPQTYDVPKARHVYYVAPDGQADAPGASPDAPTRIESAIARVVTGDAIIMRGGTYRTGGLQLNQGITIQPYRDERPVLKGTHVATTWEPLRNNVWRTKWATLFPAKPLGWWRREREGMFTPIHRFNNDMVFANGESLKSVGWEGELDAHSFYIDYESGYVYIGFDPAKKLVEITAFDIALHRPSRPVHGKASDRKGPTIRGITFTQYAYRAIDIEGNRPSVSASEEATDDPIGVADPANYGKEVVGTTLEHVTISHCSRVAGYFRGDGLTIRNSLISDTSTEGIYVIASSDVLLERNIVQRNNVEKLTGYFPAAVKIFNQSHRVLVRDNLIIDHPHSNGVWYDVGNTEGVFVNNHVEGTLIGFFFEISKGVVAAGNVFVNNVQGVRILNSANARLYHNTFYNSQAMFDRTERSAQGDHFGWHPQTGPDVDQREGHVFEGNLMVGDATYGRALLHFDQTPVLCGKLTRPMTTKVDGNLYIRTQAAVQPLISWGPVVGPNCQTTFNTLADFRKAAPHLEARGQALLGFEGTVFRSTALHNFALARLPEGVRPVAVAAEALKPLGWKTPTHVPGAFALRD
ncbi:MAG: right-handed parallel beta-helix repeat-containing protein [Pseudomonadota bacterium]